MRVLSLSSLILFFALAIPLAAQDEIFIDTFEAGATTSWDLDVSRCTQFFTGGSFTDHCYKWISGTGDWFESQAECSRWAPGGRLISAESAEEWQHVTLHRVPPNSKSWIGLSRGVRDSCPGAWAWESGEPVSFTNWDPGEPNAGGCPACATSWKDLGDRWDALACEASGLVSDAICEVDLANVRIVGGAGGRLVFSNDMVLDVPQGAVDADTAIGLRPIDCDEVDPFLNSRPLNSHDKQCLAAFDLTPSNLTLAKAATLILTLLDRDIDAIPVLMEIFPEEADYAYRPTDLTYDPASESLELKVSTGGRYALALLVEPQTSPLPSEDPFTNSPEALCEQGRIGVRSEFVDLDVAHGDVECTLIFDTVSVTFLDCEGTPTFDHDMAESVGCSEDTYFLGRICGPNVSGEACFVDPQPATKVDSFGWVRLHTWMKAIDPNQNNRELFIANVDHATYRWVTTNEKLVDFPDLEDGLLEAGECPEEACPVEVQAWNRYVSSPHSKGTVVVEPESANPYGIYDIEWTFSFDAYHECSYLNPYVVRAEERVSTDGTWTGRATFDIRSEVDWDTLSYEADGLISTTVHGEYGTYCDYGEPTARWVNYQSSIFFSMYPELTCIDTAPGVRLQEDGSLLLFWPCTDLFYQASWVQSGWSCDDPVEPYGSSEGRAEVYFFDREFELSPITSGVYELTDTVYSTEKACLDNSSYFTEIPVSIRAVRQLPP
jgi:hypothetical protein